MTRYQIPVSFSCGIQPIVEAQSREEAEELAVAEAKRFCETLFYDGESVYADDFVAAEEWMYADL